MTFDAVIVGTAPAGLSAALTLGRARRERLVIDGGPGRNAQVILAGPKARWRPS
jgi:thioredoxin reductase